MLLNVKESYMHLMVREPPFLSMNEKILPFDDMSMIEIKLVKALYMKLKSLPVNKNTVP